MRVVQNPHSYRFLFKNFYKMFVVLKIAEVKMYNFDNLNKYI